jgi:hypothetical protein
VGSLTEVIACEVRLHRARSLGALADRLFHDDCARLGSDANDAIKSPLASIKRKAPIRTKSGRSKLSCVKLYAPPRAEGQFDFTGDGGVIAAALLSKCNRNGTRNRFASNCGRAATAGRLGFG